MAKLSFLWYVCRPDQRQYHQTEIELMPDKIVVDVEIDPDMLLTDEAGNNHITPETMALVMQKLEGVFLNTQTSKPAVEDDTEGWGDTETKTDKKSPEPSTDDEDEGWGVTESDDDPNKLGSKGDSEDDVPWNDSNEEWEK